MSKTVIYKGAGEVDILGVRRIEEDHRYWYVWSGDPKDGPARLRPVLLEKGYTDPRPTLEIREDRK